MKTLNEYANELLELYRAELTNDMSLDIRLVKSWIKDQRALWLRNELNKNRTIDPDLIQDLGCVELEFVDSAECCVDTVGCSTVRTKNQIPDTIERHNSTTLTRVGPIDKKAKPYTIVDYSRVPYVGNGRHNANQIYAYKLNNRVYLQSKNMILQTLEYINIQGVFVDPEAVSAFSTCTGTSCYNDNTPFPLKEWMWNYMRGEILKLTNYKSQLPTDRNNDESDELLTK